MTINAPVIGSVDKALLALQRRGETGAAGRPLHQLAAELGLNKTSLHHALSSLKYRGFVEQDGNGNYRLGQAALLLACPLAFVLAFMAATAPARAQTTHPKPSTADLRPNDPKVPDAYALSGHFSRIVVMRMKYQTDLLHGMEKLVKQQNIRNGVILSGIGSLRGYRVHSVSSRDLPPSDTYVTQPRAPANLNGMNGYIVDGAIHAHVTLAVNGGRGTVSGHLEPGCEVLTYAIVTVGVLDIPLGRVQDQNYR